MIFNEKIKYLAGWELNFDNQVEASNYLLTHGVDKKGFKFFKNVQGAIELLIKGNIISKLYKHDEMGTELDGKNIDLPVMEWDDHKVFFLKKSKVGNHVMGGKKPVDLELPSSQNLKTPFQYIGSIDGIDPLFSWIGIPKLHIIYPIYECNMGMFLDYSDPLKPIIISETFSDDWYDGNMDDIGVIEFAETKYETTENINNDDFVNSDELLLCGVPLWYQAPEIPVCPSTHKAMKFVCTINSDSDIEVINKDMSRGLPFSNEYFCFGDHEHLFIFFNPESKVLYANWQ